MSHLIAKIEAAPLPDRYARGWHCLGLSRNFGQEPKELNYFGNRLVAYRGADFQVHILDAYCPHMGADLSKGCVEGNNILCPFHHWSWGADGACNHIPYAKNIPPRAKIKSWPTIEKNGLLYVWHDHENNPPIAEQEPPIIDEYYSDEWSDWHISEIRIHNNARELIDNMADIGHFGPVHNAPAKSFRNIADKHMYTQIMEGDPALLERAESMSSRATYYGPAIMTTNMSSTKQGMTIESRLLVSHVPVTQELFDLRFGLMIKRIDGLSRDINDAIMQQYVNSTTESFLADVDIWHNKVRVDNPILCDGDGPIHKLRQWHNQFYMNIADVPSAFNEEKEYVTL
jgi:3-ketosteroid 9alpha-monooxygenase subunit A